ncbi:MAG: glycosyltransferase family 4 protein, partial [Patescibacteria group bacterium]
MKIAIVHDFLLRLGGAERVLKVLAEMYPEAPIYTLLYDEKKVGHLFPKERVKTSPLQHLRNI